jgi:uncharacterized protein YndB with AHSA1/START domain
MPDIMHLIEIKAAPERVYDAITTAEGVRLWWTEDSDLDPQIGGLGEFRFVNRKVVTKLKVEEVTRPSRVVWKVLASNSPGGWNGSTITFDIKDAGEGGSKLLFSHRGLNDDGEGFARVNMGWAYFLVSLQQLLERGKGAPYPGIDFARMIKPAA